MDLTLSYDLEKFILSESEIIVRRLDEVIDAFDEYVIGFGAEGHDGFVAQLQAARLRHSLSSIVVERNVRGDVGGRDEFLNFAEN